MAKVRSILKLSGTLAEMTFVDSKAYGPHARNKRGTFTPITLADGMKKSAELQTQVNQIAKIVFDEVNAFVPGFKDGKFWSRLLSVFRQQQKLGNGFSYHGLDLMEMRIDYPTSKQGLFRLLKNQANGLQLHFQLANQTDYAIRLLRIAGDATLLNPYPTTLVETTIDGNLRSGFVPIELNALPKAANVLYVLHCEQLVDGISTGLLKSQSVKFLNS